MTAATETDDEIRRRNVRHRVLTAAIVAQVDPITCARIADVAGDEFAVDGSALRHTSTGLALDAWIADEAPKRWPSAIAQAPADSPPNPFGRHTMNASDAMKLARSDRPKAEQLARAAGHGSLAAALQNLARFTGRKGR